VPEPTQDGSARTFTPGLALGWAWTILASCAAAVCLLHPGLALPGVTLFLSALAACPSAPSLLEKTGTKLGSGARLALVFIFAGLAGLSLAQNPTAKSLLPRAAAPAPLPAKTLLEDHGDFGNKASRLFTPQGADWNLQWSFDCASLGDSGNFSVKVMRQGGAASGLAAVERINDRDSGVEHYRQVGTFYLQVVSECQWSVRVVG
jgi:hypothetical protein